MAGSTGLSGRSIVIPSNHSSHFSHSLLKLMLDSEPIRTRAFYHILDLNSLVMKRIAIVSINRDKYSETFIHNHVRHLAAEIHFMTGGYLPEQVSRAWMVPSRSLPVMRPYGYTERSFINGSGNQSGKCWKRRSGNT